MLNWNQVLMYVKGRLSLPSGYLEKTDQEIKDWILLKTIPEFSNWYPDTEFTAVIPTNRNYISSNNRAGNFLFFDSENIPILGIRECYFPATDAFTTGHPIIGPVDIASLQNWALQVFSSKLVAPFSEFSYSYTFRQPNIVCVLPAEHITENFVIEYERQQPPDLSKIPVALTSQFLDLCFADIAIWIGGLRSMYTNTSTPFGEIPLRGEELLQRGEDMRRELIDKWTDDTVPPLIIDIY
jgi:hypothetical protein